MYRKGVSALIMNKENKFLLVNLQSFNEKYFAVPGGGLKKGESTDNAVYREIQEELGLDKKSLALCGKCERPVFVTYKEIQLQRDGIHYEGSERYFYGFRFTGDDSEIILQVNEVRTYQWVAYSNLKDYLLFDDQLTETSKIIEYIFHTTQ